MRQKFLTDRKFIAYWLFNIGLGIPTPYVLIYMIFGFYGFMSPPSMQDRYMAAGVLCVYLLVWFIGNYMCLRKEDRGTKFGMLALSLLPLAISSFISFKIIASISS
ncbi:MULTISPECIES: hypothetical protein [unclassified Paenibacillus]|uniref:hypothetical protein n=1 Tax=unclassified Paenibacillus TaxID=185978 RepID=UPI00278A43DD|nr:MULTISPECIES: hypothetical protein [unclassified Paenibacillus]MDQ0902462.1 hypothetical protein [Paenibacillus sp. V4I7]MDQ0919026.1 hypothetical protein [Paenibacillus sp. V4I5]